MCNALDIEPVITTTETSTAEEFADYRQALVDLKLEKDKRLREETARWWNELVPHGTYDFERGARDASVVAELTLAQLLECWHSHFARTSPTRRKLSAQVFAAHHVLPPKPSSEHITVLDTLEEQVACKLHGLKYYQV